MTKILFVDDESNALASVRDLLRLERHHWELAFANGGEAALEVLRAGDFDVIITDLRMPGMDGATLLHHVKREYPGIARIVLSGPADQDAIMSAAPVAQQFLSRPCEGSALTAAIERTCALHSLLNNGTIRDLVGKVGRLPSVPDVYWDLTHAVAGGNSCMSVITDIIERDPAMAAKILQLVNSAYFGLAVHITSIERAVTHLGLELVKGLALSANVFGLLDPSMTHPALLELHEQSLAGARLARAFAVGAANVDDVFTAAVLRDIGHVVLALGLPDRCEILARRTDRGGKPVHVVEQECLGVSHAEVGAYLLGLWGLPLSIVEAVAYHHSPSRATTGERSLLAMVHVADGLTNELWHRGDAGQTTEWLDAEFLQVAGVAHLLPRWRSLAGEQLSVAAAGAEAIR